MAFGQQTTSSRSLRPDNPQRAAANKPQHPRPPLSHKKRVSKDIGETLTPVKNPGGFRGAHASVRANRLRPDWLLALAKRPDCHTLDDLQIRCPSDLFVAKVRGGGRGGG